MQSARPVYRNRLPRRYEDFVVAGYSRTPRWRYDRVQSCLASPANYLRKAEDPVVREAYRIMRRWPTRRGSALEFRRARQQMYQESRALYAACEIYQAPQLARVRVSIEAYILAKLSDAEIAHHLSTDPQVIDWYEALFFNVRDRLDNKDYICSQVIGPIGHVSLGDLSNETVCRYHAYHGGPVVAMDVLRGFNDANPQPGPGGDPAEYYGHLWDHATHRKGATVSTFEPMTYDAGAYQDRLLALRLETKRLQADGALAQAGYVENVQTTMRATSWGSGRAAQAAVKRTPLGEYSGHARELRAGEMLQVITGSAPAGLSEQVKVKKLPPPRKTDDA